MTEREERELRNYCAWILKEYGFDFAPTDPVIPALYVIHRQMMATRKSNEVISTSMKDLAATIKPTVYNFSQPGEAWKFQIAQGLKWFLIVSGIIISSWSWYLVFNAKKEIEYTEKALRNSPRVTQGLSPLVKKDKEGFLFLEFDKAEGSDIANFTQYIGLSNGKVRVYLGKEQ